MLVVKKTYTMDNVEVIPTQNRRIVRREKCISALLNVCQKCVNIGIMSKRQTNQLSFMYLIWQHLVTINAVCKF